MRPGRGGTRALLGSIGSGASSSSSWVSFDVCGMGVSENAAEYSDGSEGTPAGAGWNSASRSKCTLSVRPPYSYPWKRRTAFCASCGDAKSTVPKPRLRPSAFSATSARWMLPAARNRSLRSCHWQWNGRLPINSTRPGYGSGAWTGGGTGGTGGCGYAHATPGTPPCGHGCAKCSGCGSGCSSSPASSLTLSTRPCHVYPCSISVARSASSIVANSTVPLPLLRPSGKSCTSARSTVPARRNRSLTSCQRALNGRLRTASWVRLSLAAMELASDARRWKSGETERERDDSHGGVADGASLPVASNWRPRSSGRSENAEYPGDGCASLAHCGCGSGRDSSGALCICASSLHGPCSPVWSRARERGAAAPCAARACQAWDALRASGIGSIRTEARRKTRDVVFF